MNLSAIALGGLPHLWYFGLAKPYRTWRNRDAARYGDSPPSRVQYYRNAIPHFLSCGFLSLGTLALLGWFSSGAARTTDIVVLGRLVARPRDVWFGLFPAQWPSLVSAGLGLIAYAIMISIDLAYSRRCFDRGDAHMYAATPQSMEERVVWIGFSLAAGVTEELTWRGVQPELIAQVTGHLWPAIVICAATFGIGHVTQGRPFVPIAALFALVFHALTLLTGSLYVPILVHAAMNITVGLRAGRWVKPQV